MVSNEKQSAAKSKKTTRKKKQVVRHTKTTKDTAKSHDRSSTGQDIKPVDTLFAPAFLSGELNTYQADLYDLVPVAYITLDVNGNIEKLNQAATKLLANKSSSICGKSFVDYIANEDVNKFNKYIQNPTQGAKSGIELKLHDEQMENINVRLEAIQICDADKEICNNILSLIDITEEKRVKKELQHKEQEFRLITDNLPIVVAYVDKHQHYKYNNKTYEKWFGYTPEQAYGRHLKEMFGNRIYQKVEKYINKVLSGETVNFEVDIPDSRIGKRYLCVNYVPHLDENKEVQGFFVLGSDITRRLEAEDELREERDFAEGLISTAQMIVVVLDPEGRIVSINPYLEKISGYQQHEVGGKDWFSTFLPEKDQKELSKVFSDAISGSETKGKINPILTKDGQLCFIEWYDTRLKDKQGNITGLLAVGQNITGHIQLQQSLQESEARYRLLAEYSTDMITRQDSSGIYLYVSPASYLLQGYKPEELTGESFYNYVHPDDLNMARNNIATALQQGESILTTIRLLHKNGRYIWVEINSTPLVYKEHGAADEIISVVRNITEQKKLELMEKKYFLKQAHESRVSSMGEMTTEIAHELNQPLSAISIYSDAAINLIPEQFAQNKDLVNALQEIKSQANRAGDIIHRLRELVSKKGPHYSTININELINGLVRLIEVETRWHKCKLQLNLTEPLPIIFADQVLIEQAILNIVRNGIEAMDGISVQQRVLTISSTLNKSNEIELEISDTGPGMSAKQIKKAFESFYTTKPSGMGMGLSITQTIIKSHGGRIWAIPNEVGGTTFVLTIPINEHGTTT